MTEDHVLETTSDLSGLWAILKLGEKQHLKLLGAVLLIVCSSIVVMMSARILGFLVESVHSGQYQVLSLVTWFLVLETSSIVMQYFGRLSLAHSTIEVTYSLRCRLFDKLRTLPMSYFDTQPLGRTITRLTTDVEGVESFFSGTLSRLVVSTIHIVTVLIAMLVTQPSFGVIVVGCSIPALVFSIASRKPVRFWMRTYRRRSAHLNSILAEFLNGMPVIKAFGLEKWTQNRFTNGSQSLLTSAINMMNWNSLIRPMTVLLCGLPLVVILWWGGHLVTVGALEIGLLVTYIRYSERFMGPIRTISQEIQHIQEALVSSERVRQMLSEEVENDVMGDDGQLALPIEGQIKFEDVCMEYIKGKPILNGVSFEIAAGETVAFVGATGSGKTTTVNLIPKLYPISSGEITLDGYDLRDWSRKGIRKNLGYVGQDVVIFRGTIRENLLAAVDDSIELSDQKILAACERTGLSSIIERFKDGLDYNILEAGKNLSMGERQLIAFTRMLLKDPAILILDEATANIDEHCEKLIQKAVSELMEHRTCIVIAHRLSTILHADQILVFKDGRVVEKGCHEDLVAHNGIYAELIRRQIDGHLD